MGSGAIGGPGRRKVSSLGMLRKARYKPGSKFSSKITDGAISARDGAAADSDSF